MLQTLVLASVVVQMRVSCFAQALPRGGVDTLNPQITLSTSVLDFGPVGVGTAKELSLTVQNIGGGILKGRATVAGPFSIEGQNYALQSGQSQSITVRYEPEAPGTNREYVVFSGGSGARMRVTGRAGTIPSPPSDLRIANPSHSRFTEEAQADFVIKYFSDEVSYITKPAKVEVLINHRFQTALSRNLVLKLAAEQARHELAVVELMHYSNAGPKDAVRRRWIDDLKGLRYRRLVFLRGSPRTLQANGLPVLADISLETPLGAEGPPPTATPLNQ